MGKHGTNTPIIPTPKKIKTPKSDYPDELIASLHVQIGKLEKENQELEASRGKLWDERIALRAEIVKLKRDNAVYRGMNLKSKRVNYHLAHTIRELYCLDSLEIRKEEIDAQEAKRVAELAIKKADKS